MGSLRDLHRECEITRPIPVKDKVEKNLCVDCAFQLSGNPGRSCGNKRKQLSVIRTCHKMIKKEPFLSYLKDCLKVGTYKCRRAQRCPCKLFEKKVKRIKKAVQIGESQKSS